MMQTDHKIIATGYVHANTIRFNELPLYEAEFRAAVAKRAPGVPFTLEYRAHPNSLLNLEGDRMCVAVPVDG